MKPALIVAAAVVLGLAACAPTRHQPSGPESDLMALQRELSESREKIDQLTQRVTLIQILVDSHQRTLQDLAESTAAGDVDSDSDPAFAVPETETASDFSRTPPLADEMEQAAPVSEAASSEASPDSREVETTLSESSPEPREAETVSSEPFPEPREVETTQRPETEERLMAPGPNPLYQEAMEIFRGGNYETADGLFENFARQFPKDDLADNALYWSGECRYARKDYAGALEQFRQVIEDYPSGSKVPDALLKIGLSHLSLGDKESAVTYLKKVMSQYPFSAAGAKAEERLKTLQK